MVEQLKSDQNLELGSSSKAQQSKSKYILEINIGDLNFSNLNGDILTSPKPYLLQSTIRGSKFKCHLNDLKGDLREKISQHKKAIIKIGFGENNLKELIVPQIEGLIWEVVKKPPDAVCIVIADIKLELKQDQGISQGMVKEGEESLFSSEINQEESKELSSLLDFADTSLSNSGDQLEQTSNFLSTLLENQTTNSDPLYTFFTDNSKFSFDSSVKIGSKQGFIKTQRSDLQEINQTAKFQGDKIVSGFNKVRQVSSINRKDSGIFLDYTNKRYIFVNSPEIGKRNPINRRSGQGSVTVKGWNVNNKGTVGATSVSRRNFKSSSNEVLEIPDWGSLKMNDQIIPELPFTWGDATKDGSRVPGKPEIEQIIKIAKALVPVYQKSGKTWTITSWYRPKEVNRQVGGSPNSKHIEGHAVDFYFSGINKFFQNELANKWDGGHALSFGSFIHLDLGSKRTWNY